MLSPKQFQGTPKLTKVKWKCVNIKYTLMAHHKVGESVKDVKGKSCDEVEEEPGAEVVHLVGKVHKSDQQIKLTHSK